VLSVSLSATSNDGFLKEWKDRSPPAFLHLTLMYLFHYLNYIFGRLFVKRFALCYWTVVLSVWPVCNVGVLWPNGCMHQDETWHGGRPWPWPHCVRWGPSSPSPKGEQPPVFGPCFLWPNGWMDQDATWQGGRPWPMPHCVRWGPSCPLKSPKKGAQPPIFGPCLLWPNGWMDQDATWYEGRPRPRPHCVAWGSSFFPHKGHCPPIFGSCLLWTNGRPSQLLLSTC